MLSNLEYLSYPLPPDIRRLSEAGDFARMEHVIALRCADPCTPECLKERLRFELEVAKLTPKYYPYTKEEIFAMLRKRIPDITEEEIEALRDDGTFDWRYINGEVRYRRNCIGSMLKTRKEYAEREIGREAAEDKEKRHGTLDDVIARMKEKGHLHARFELHEEMTVNSDRLTPGETLRIHLPMPVVYAQVKSASLLSSSHAPVCVNDETEPHRCVYFELPYEPGMTVSADIAYEIDAPYVNPDPDKVLAEQPDFDTEEILPHVVFTPYLRALAAEIVGDETNPLKKARLIYDFITTKCVYRFMPAYKMVVTPFPEYFATGQRGDCGIHAITFITLCRLCGIPAQWQAGLYTKPDDVGNHDWARFYIAPYGWLYADCSFGGSAYRADSEMRREFYFSNLEPWRMPLCRAFQQELNPPKKFMRFDPYDHQNGEIESLTRALDGSEYDTNAHVISYTELD